MNRAQKRAFQAAFRHTHNAETALKQAARKGWFSKILKAKQINLGRNKMKALTQLTGQDLVNALKQIKQQADYKADRKWDVKS